MTKFLASPTRYDEMEYRRAGTSGLTLPAISLGLWHNFGDEGSYETAKEMVLHSFDRGITHFDLANNYGTPPGSAELTMGRILKTDLAPYRDQLIITSKAGHEMWEGPYGGNSSRKNIIASADQSLQRLSLDYVDIFYTHRYDGVTPIEETARALVDLVRSGRALYIGISKYPPQEAELLYSLLKAEHVPAIVAQYRYSLFERSIEEAALSIAAKNGAGVVAFSPLAQGLLSDKYINGIPSDSRAASGSRFLTPAALTDERLTTIKELNAIALQRGNTLAQVALKWALRDSTVCSLVIGASSCGQIDENLAALKIKPFSADELSKIDVLTK